MWSLADQMLMLRETEEHKPIHQLTTLSDQYGATYFALLSDIDRNPTLLDAITHSNWPPGVLENIASLRIDEVPGLSSAIMRFISPFFWSSQETTSITRDDNAMLSLDLLEDLQLSTGLIIPTIAPNGSRNAAIFGSLRKLLSHRDIANLQYSTFKVFERMWGEADEVEFSSNEGGNHQLSDRERECLYWSAQGKTSSEIGTVLGLSVFTINQYLNNASIKLEATNRTQAVASAIKRRII